jgi:hypothetical protein
MIIRDNILVPEGRCFLPSYASLTQPHKGSHMPELCTLGVKLEHAGYKNDPPGGLGRLNHRVHC